MAVKIKIPFGNECQEFEVPVQNLLQVLSPNCIEIDPQEQKIIREAIKNPIGTDRLEVLIDRAKSVRKVQKICIICDDITRSTPTNKIIPEIVEVLNDCGIEDKDIYIVMALGSHRYMTENEMKFKVGEEIFRRISVYNSQFNNKESLVKLGTTNRGVPILLDKRVAQADIKIGIGSILPHPVVGWSGGAKIIFPGVTGEETVTAFHLNYAKFTTNMFGADITPVREEIEEWTQTIGLDFIVNCIYTPRKEVYRVVAGHYLDAQRIGREYSKEVYGVKVYEKADLTIVSSYPADLDLWQATKAVCGAEHTVKGGGEIVLVTPCHEGIGPHKDLDILINQGKDNPEELLKQSYENQVADPLAASGAIHLGKVIAKNKTISLVCPNISFKQAGRMGWKKYNSVEEVISIALKRNKNVKINIITHGGYLCPIYENR